MRRLFKNACLPRGMKESRAAPGFVRSTRAMKILLTGILPPFIPTIAARLMRGGHQVSVMGPFAGADRLSHDVKYQDVHPNHPDALRLIEASGYEAVLFFFACQCEAAGEYGCVQGAMLDALYAMLGRCGRSGVKRFVLLTDRRVFGDAQEGREDETPFPDTPTGVVIKAAEDCLAHGTPEGMDTLLVRVTSPYEPGDCSSFFARAAACAAGKRPLVLSGSRQTPCDFVHADDLAAFLDFALGDNLSGVAHVFYGRPCTYGEVENLLHRYYPQLECTYTGGGRAGTLMGTAMRRVDWVPRHDFSRELDTLFEKKMRPIPASHGEKRQSRLSRLLRGLLPWAELLLMALLTLAAEDAARENALFSVVDYRLLFVAIMGNVHGIRFGVLAALLACVHYALAWTSQGQELYMLLYNADHWLPLGCYMLCGALFGYLHDKGREQLAMSVRERKELEAQNEFLQTLYHRAYEDRNQLQEQVMHFRDSYGRIYHITRELDTLQPEQVFLSTLGVLEDTMQNRSVAIYACGGTSPFIRLVVHSRSMKKLPRSLNLEDLSDMAQCLREGRVFANKALLSGCPAYAAPVMHEGRLYAILMLWEVPFEKQTQYLENLLSVVAGLVQSAMVRALHYFSLADDLYVPGTHILTDKAFRNALGVYQNIRKKRSGQHLLVCVSSSVKRTVQAMDERIARVARSTDLAGMLDDGRILVLFPQAGVGDLPQIAERFAQQGLICEVVSQEVAYA